MKSRQKLLIVTIVVIVNALFNDVFGQATEATNTRVPGHILGWDGSGTGNSGSLEIRNDFNRPIKFFTNTSERVVIDSLGNFGIGTATPATLLHIDGTNPPQDESLAAYYRTQDCSARSPAQKSCVNGGVC